MSFSARVRSPDLNGNVKTVFAIRDSCHTQGKVGATLFLPSSFGGKGALWDGL
jgi:hypothetical protein